MNNELEAGKRAEKRRRYMWGCCMASQVAGLYPGRSGETGNVQASDWVTLLCAKIKWFKYKALDLFPQSLSFLLKDGWLFYAYLRVSFQSFLYFLVRKFVFLKKRVKKS